PRAARGGGGAAHRAARGRSAAVARGPARAWRQGNCRHARAADGATRRQPCMPSDEAVVRALRLLASGEPGQALRALKAPGRAEGEGRLRAALREYLQAAGDGRGYEDPAAFQAFISGGGNVALYRATSTTLAAEYAAGSIATVLDVGCGDGRAVVPAAASRGPGAPELDLVEPSAALLGAAEEHARAAGLRFTSHHSTLQDWLRHAGGK